MTKIEKNGWELVTEDKGLPVYLHQIVLDSDEDAFKVSGGYPPHKPSSSGKVWGYWIEEHDPDESYRHTEREYYPSVFNLKWRKKK